MEPEGIEMSAPVQGDGSDRRKEDRWLAGGMAAHPGVPEVLVTIDGILLVVGVSPGSSAAWDEN
jgi:hypothetical protein